MTIQTVNRYDYWEVLQEPSIPTTFSATFLLLLSALDTGWKLSGPVLYLAPRAGYSPGQYQIDLEKEESSSMCSITINKCPELEDYIQKESIPVIQEYS